MIYKKFKDVEIFNNPTHTAYEYNIDDKDINFCIATIQGRSSAWFPQQHKIIED